MTAIITVNDALGVLNKHVAAMRGNLPASEEPPSFTQCMDAFRALYALRGEAARKAEDTIIAVARESNNAWLKHAALYRLHDMVAAEQKEAEEKEVPPSQRKLATPNLLVAMAAVYFDDADENFRDQAGQISKAMREQKLRAHELARKVIEVTLRSNPNPAMKIYWESEQTKNNKAPVKVPVIAPALNASMDSKTLKAMKEQVLSPRKKLRPARQPENQQPTPAPESDAPAPSPLISAPSPTVEKSEPPPPLVEKSEPPPLPAVEKSAPPPPAEPAASRAPVASMSMEDKAKTISPTLRDILYRPSPRHQHLVAPAAKPDPCRINHNRKKNSGKLLPK